MLQNSLLWFLLGGSAVMMLALIGLADREGTVNTLPEAATTGTGPAPRGRASNLRVQPVHLRRGSPDAPRTKTVAFSLHRDGMLLTGPPELRVNDVVYLEAGREPDPVRAAARVIGETPTGYKDVRFERAGARPGA
jgi:hypothetical protein